jgi:hypothetical protein
MNSNADRELMNNPEYRRILAALPPDDRLRLLGLDFNMQGQLAKKREYRRALAKLSPAEKMRLLEELRERADVLRGLRKTPSLGASAAVAKSQPPFIAKKKSKIHFTTQQESAHRFGGRANAGGVNYEARVAAFIGVKMLCGTQSAVWENINGADIHAIAMQTLDLVDDVVMTMKGSSHDRIFISAKERSKTVALTATGAFGETVDAFIRQFLSFPKSARTHQLVWAVPDGVGRKITHDLPKILNEHRNATGIPFSEFVSSRQSGEKQVLNMLQSVTVELWNKHTENSPAESELQDFFKCVFIKVLDFSPGHRLLPEIEGELRNHVVADPTQAKRTWEKLEHFFLQADCHGVPINVASLRKVLIDDGIKVKITA